MSFPKYQKISENNIDKIEVKFLKEHYRLLLDREKCTGCNVCVRICPKDAFRKYKPEGPKDLFGKKVIYKKKRYYVPFVEDPDICVFCGLCTYLCPFEALKIESNGKEVKQEKIKLVELEAVPKLIFKRVKLNSGEEAKVYTQGKIDINVEECNTGCKNCAEICPTGAIRVGTEVFSKKDNEWEKDLKIEIYPNECIYCGACYSICPTGAVKLHIEEINYSGKYNSPFWDDILDKLKLNGA
ncbi:MAG: putative formylmethanofuran dehydrogenase subunit F [Promethearchaeota archaeon]|nr:MAG: putative formylmethanofuran dehydrogenase subunit F [Candidatus Lokiarchaeota archaeon]